MSSEDDLFYEEKLAEHRAASRHRPWMVLYSTLTAAEALGVGRTRPHLNDRAQRILNYLRARRRRTSP